MPPQKLDYLNRNNSDEVPFEGTKEIEDGAPVVETLRAKGVSPDTYYKKRKYSGIEQNDKKTQIFRERKYEVKKDVCRYGSYE
jgi:hypothetical protein